MNRLTAGALAGAVGTLALDAATYADVALRGRPPSQVPAETVGRAVDAAGIDLAGGDGEKGANRESGIGALLGYLTGVGTGVAFGMVRPLVPRIGVPLAGLGVGLAAMVGANAGAIAAGTTDPREWGTSGWLADAIPHAVYGLVTAAVFARLTGDA